MTVPFIPVSAKLFGKRVVIVEDEGLMQMQLCKAFTQSGLIVVGQAMSGEEGVGLILREKPDMVIMDIVLSGMDGIEATRHVMKHFPTCVIVVSAHIDQHLQREAREAGASGYVAKPVSFEMLRKAMEDCYDESKPGDAGRTHVEE
jgi:DNA-binding NarL/FixJ family response regulator